MNSNLNLTSPMSSLGWLLLITWLYKRQLKLTVILSLCEKLFIKVSIIMMIFLLIYQCRVYGLFSYRYLYFKVKIVVTTAGHQAVLDRYRNWNFRFNCYSFINTISRRTINISVYAVIVHMSILICVYDIIIVYLNFM